MFKILVPVDFHKTSFSALDYATKFGALIPNSKITLIHVIDGTFNTNEAIAFEPLLTMEEASKQRLDYFYKEYPAKVGVELGDIPIDTEVRFGIPGFTVSTYANEHSYDMVIMGTRDKHGIFDRLLGSTSAITIRQAECPVLLIHERVKFNTPEKIVFAFNEKVDIEDAMEEYLKINNNIKAVTNFVNVTTNGQKNLSDQQREIVETLFEDDESNFIFEVESIQGEDFFESLKDYCLFEKADLLAMIHRKEGIFTSIFRKQHSVRMAQGFHLPVIVFQEKQQ